MSRAATVIGPAPAPPVGLPPGCQRRPVVVIAAATVDRPAGLRRLLDGLARLTFERVAEPEIHIVIVDNSAEGTARSQVEAAARHWRWKLHYHHEPRPGLAQARNAQLEAAPEGASWLAMIDDDEVPDPAWLDALLATAKRTGARLVAGPVVPVFDEPPPLWAVANRFFEVGPFTDGAPIDFLYTGNVLVSLPEVRRAGWRFDIAFNRSGGEDEHFFRRALAAGLEAVCAAEARVYESIPPAKTSAGWVLRRYFRMGTTLATIDRLHDPSPGMAARRGCKAILRMAAGLVALARLPVEGRPALLCALADSARGAGAVAGLLGIRYAEYARGR